MVNDDVKKRRVKPIKALRSERVKARYVERGEKGSKVQAGEIRKDVRRKQSDMRELSEKEQSSLESYGFDIPKEEKVVEDKPKKKSKRGIKRGKRRT